MKLIYTDFSASRAETEASQFTVGNGKLGLRGIQDEDYAFETPGLFLAGVFASSMDETPHELVNLPNAITNTIMLDDECFSLNGGELVAYQREMNESRGILTRRVVWKSKKGKQYQITTERFADQEHPVLYQRISILPLSGTAHIQLTTGIDGSVTNSGRQHLLTLSKRQIDPQTIGVNYRLNDSETEVAIAAHYSLLGRAKLSDRHFLKIFTGEATSERAFVLEKVIAVSSNIYRPLPLEECLNWVNSRCSFAEELERTGRFWSSFWKHNRVVVNSHDPEDQELLDFALYHLAIMAPRDDSRFSIGAKGLTGEGYKGHAFWDNELFIWPFFQSADSTIARNLLLYRFNNLPGARKKAKRYGYKGAWFPWESAYLGVEETPQFASIDIKTGEAEPVTSYLHEIHIDSDIAYAFNQAAVVQDGWQRRVVLKEIVHFWLSRAIKEEDGCFHFRDVTGPDEYTERVNDNAYTNYSIYMVLKAILPELDPLEQEQAENLLNLLYLPRPDNKGIIPQDDTFLSKPDLELSEFRNSHEQQLILTKYTRDQVINAQVLKQADLAMLFFLYPELFDEITQKKNLDYYEQRTVHDSSLSKPIYGIVSARLGDTDKGYDFFKATKRTDFLGIPHASDSGIHAASMGAIWMMVIKGFLDVRIEGLHSLTMNPKLPMAWDSVEVPFQLGKHWLMIEVNHKKVKIVNFSDSAVKVKVRKISEVILVKPNSGVTLLL